MKAMQPQLLSLRALTIRTTAIALLLLVAGCGEPTPPPTPPAAPPPQAAPAPKSSAPAKPAPNNQTATSAIPGKLALAMHLKQTGAKMYGTYWCSTCQRQLYRFGSEAASQINYIECDPAGKNPQTDLCRQANIRAFPTWEINGYLYPPGGLRLEALADYSGYQGPRNFTN